MLFIFFFKQKTAYEMRISDWSSDVCSSDLEEPARAAEAFNGALPCLHIDDGGPVIPGQPSYEGARTALQPLAISAGLARSCSAGGTITAPVSKKQLYSVGFTHAGQTEFIAERSGVPKSNPAMMLVGPYLVVGP